MGAFTWASGELPQQWFILAAITGATAYCLIKKDTANETDDIINEGPLSETP